MAEMDTIREFLVALGYHVDGDSERKVRNSIADVTMRVVKLATAVEAMSAAFVAGMAKVASAMESLYYTSQRTQSTVESIQAIAFATSQMGGSADGARNSLENLAAFLRNSPGAAGLLRSLGVSTSGGAAETMQELFARFRQMPFYRANAYAQMLGIDQNTLIAGINGTGAYSAQFQQMSSAIGLHQGDYDRAHQFMVQVRDFLTAIELIGMKAASLLAGPVGGALAALQKSMIANSPQIIRGLNTIVSLFTTIGAVIAHLAIGGVEFIAEFSEWFDHLSVSGQHLIEMFGALVVAWRVLGFALLASPMGALMGIIAAVLLLFDDYATWKSGGKSEIDWGKWMPDLIKIRNVITGITDHIGGWHGVFIAILAYVGGTWIIGMLGVMATLGTAIAGVATTIAGVTASLVAAGVAAAGTMASIGALAALPALLALWPAMTEGEREEQVQIANSYMSPKNVSPNPKYNTTSGRILSYLQSQGWSAKAASGILANLSAEDSTFDPGATSDGGAHYGIAQWDASRQALFQKIMGKPIQGSTVGDQLAFMSWEFSHSEAPAAQAIRAASTAAGAGAAMSHNYERVGSNIQDAARAAAAQTVYNQNFSISAPQSTSITVHGATQPQQVASAVARHQGLVNEAHIRNVKAITQ
jgi:hypothetical protein